MAYRNFRILSRTTNYLLLSFLTIFVLFGCVEAIDSDNDGLEDSDEIKFHTDINDADSDDDGVLDGYERDWNKNTDGKGDINALDFDSDDDGIWDGVEMGITEVNLHNDTDLTKNHFKADADPETNTSMIHWDTDGDHLGDAEEDLNKNGRYDKELNETDPLYPDRDGDGFVDAADVDIDGDGMYNLFEKTYGLDIYDPSDADFDPDNDGFSNLYEYLGNDNKAGNQDWSDPLDPNSFPDLPPSVIFAPDKIEKYINSSVVIDSKILQVDDSLQDIGMGLVFVWKWGDGNDDQDIIYNPDRFTKEHIYTKVGRYVLSLEVFDQYNKSSNDSIIIVIQESPDIPNPNDTTMGDGDNKDGSDEFNLSYNNLYSSILTLIFIGLLVVLLIVVVIFFIFWPKGDKNVSAPSYYKRSRSEDSRVVPSYLDDIESYGRNRDQMQRPRYYDDYYFKRPQIKK